MKPKVRDLTRRLFGAKLSDGYLIPSSKDKVDQAVDKPNHRRIAAQSSRLLTFGEEHTKRSEHTVKSLSYRGRRPCRCIAEQEGRLWSEWNQCVNDGPHHGVWVELLVPMNSVQGGLDLSHCLECQSLKQGFAIVEAIKDCRAADFRRLRDLLQSCTRILCKYQCGSRKDPLIFDRHVQKRTVLVSYVTFRLVHSSVTRQVFPDRLRGISLLGIVVVNVPFLGISSNGFTQASIQGPADTATAFLVFLLAQGKFYLLFAFLFGYSSAFILKNGAPEHRRRFRKRLLVLAGFGLFHAVFLFIGDILLTYALLGVGLLAISGKSDRVVKRTALLSLAAGMLVFALVVVLVMLEPQDWVTTAAVVGPDWALRHGSFLDAALARASALPSALALVLVLQGCMAFSAFCAGLLASRSQMLATPASHAVFWKRSALFGLLFGLPVQVLATWLQLRDLGNGRSSSASDIIGTALGFGTAPILAIGYLGLFGWGLSRRPDLLRITEPAGRASLSLYLGESAILALIFCGYGLGQFEQLSAAWVVFIGIGTWLALETLAKLWLSHFSQGPLEMLLARWTGKSRLQQQD